MPMAGSDRGRPPTRAHPSGLADGVSTSPQVGFGCAVSELGLLGPQGPQNSECAEGCGTDGDRDVSARNARVEQDTQGGVSKTCDQGSDGCPPEGDGGDADEGDDHGEDSIGLARLCDRADSRRVTGHTRDYRRDEEGPPQVCHPHRWLKQQPRVQRLGGGGVEHRTR